MVDTHDKHWGISTGGRDDHSLGTTFQVSLRRDPRKCSHRTYNQRHNYMRYSRTYKSEYMFTYRGLLSGGKDTSGFHNILSTSITPLNVSWVPPERMGGKGGKPKINQTQDVQNSTCPNMNSLAENCDGMSINDQFATFSLDLPLVPSMSGVILEHVHLSRFKKNTTLWSRTRENLNCIKMLESFK